jgi:outer membrane receptor protein involved in Fe transport
MRLFRLKKCLFASAAATAVIGAPTGAAWAQADSEMPAQSRADKIDPVQAPALAEVIVTANKRKERINDVGMTISAISSDALAERKISTLDEIASAVPGFSFAKSPSDTPVLTLRGVGYNSRQLGSYPAVSLYVDQQPLPFPILALHAAYDLERVEVLEGPQGTLFGENATGGAINFIDAKPTGEPHAGADITYGRFKRVESNAYLSGPLSGNLRARVAVNAVDSQGWQVSTTRPQDRNGAQRYVAGRLILDWDPGESVRFSLNANGWVDTSEPQAPQAIGYYPTIPGGTPPGVLPLTFSPETPRAADWGTGSYKPHSRRDLYQLALRADIDLTRSLTLTSLTSDIGFTQSSTQDIDGTPLDIDSYREGGNIHTFTQELRLANNPSARLRWVLGGNYEDSRTYDLQEETFTKNSVAVVIRGADQFTRQKIRNFAIFGNGQYDITQRLATNLGARYTETRNRAALCAADYGDGSVAGFFNYLGSLTGAPFTPVGFTGPIDQRCASLNQIGVPALLPTQETLSQNNVSWRFGLNYRLAQDALLYANVSKGYKAGSFPILGATLVEQFKPVTQESVLAYEAGIKTDLFDRRAHLNLAAFYYDYRDKQVTGRGLFPPFGPQTILVNVPKSRIEGVDGDLAMRLMDDLTVTAAVTYLDTRILEYRGYNSIPAIVNFAGARLPFAPQWNYRFDVEYRPPVGREGNAIIGATVYGQSSQDTVIGGGSFNYPPSPTTIFLPGITHPYTTNPYTLIDLRLGYEAGAWRVLLFAKNVLNKYYWSNVSDDSEVKTRYAGMPATYGVTVGVRF